MSKRNVAYIKPDEPSFLRKIKEQIGYKEGPTVDTKREVLDAVQDEDFNDEDPTVVVLNPGDLTAEQAAEAKNKLEQEKAEAPADLNQRVIFKAPEKASESSSKGKKRSSSEKSHKSKEKKSKSLLSFDDEEDEEL